MQDEAQKDPLVEFILDRIPADLLAAYRRLSNLSYPVPDLKTFLELLEQHQDKDDQFVNSLLREVFNIDAFPLASRQNAFEKFHSNLPLTLQVVPLGGDLPPEVPPLELPSSILAAVTPEALNIESTLPVWWTIWFAEWWRRIVCRSRCEDEYRRCIERAGGNERERSRCEIRRAFCRRQCG